MLYFLILELESSVSVKVRTVFFWENIRNSFFWENIRGFLIFELETSISRDMKNF